MSESSTAAIGQSAHARPGMRLWTRDLVLIILVNLCVFTNHIMSLSTFPFFDPEPRWNGGRGRHVRCCPSRSSLSSCGTGRWLVARQWRATRRACDRSRAYGASRQLGYVFVPTMSLAIALRMVHGVGLSFSNSTTATVASDVIWQAALCRGDGLFRHGAPPSHPPSHRRSASRLWRAVASRRSYALLPPSPWSASCSSRSSTLHLSDVPRKSSTCVRSSTAIAACLV